MKRYLSPYHLGNQPERLTQLVGGNKRAAIVMNAADFYGDEKRPAYLGNEVAAFEALGIKAEELDLRDYFDRPEPLEAELLKFGLVWVMGGNVFVLAQAMKRRL